MADTAKLASTFDAWRITLGVLPEKLAQAIKYCEELGIQPRIRNYQKHSFTETSTPLIVFTVILPKGVYNHTQQFINEHRERLGGAISLNTIGVELICPLVNVGSKTIEEILTYRSELEQRLKECGTLGSEVDMGLSAEITAIDWVLGGGIDENKVHPSHKTRMTDSSVSDEICINCGARDQVPGGLGKLIFPCPKPHGPSKY